jgi:phosphoglycerol transferase MdoB-like AlkP superfamily enzyme
VYKESKKLLPNSLRSTPNVLVIFLESFSTIFSGPYNGDFAKATPNITAISQDPDTTLFHNYYSAGFPSMPGYFTQFCSTLFPSGQAELRDEKFVRHHFLCLPKILSDRGYETVFVSGIDKRFTHKDIVLPAMGFEQVLDKFDIEDATGESILGWGYTDHQLFPYIQSQLETIEEPFLLAVPTLDSHSPFNLSKDMTIVEPGNDLINSFASTDDAFGTFWKEFKKGPHYDNTIVILTSDQTIPPMKSLQKEYGELMNIGLHARLFDETLLLMHIPDSVLPREVDIVSSHIDLTPTILHMMGINVPNGFEGHSIFGSRESYPNILGLNEFNLFSHSKDEELFASPVTNHRCSEEELSGEKLTECELKDYFWWKRYMLENDRLWEK